jgi:sulfate adenylyltransferase subunit 1 (EFTu-like GTPase family)
MGDNLIKKSDNMGWWKGKEVKTLDDRKVTVSGGGGQLGRACKA